jgi:cytochrome c oxidase assembly protein subunit 15
LNNKVGVIMQRLYKWLCVATAVGMGLVLLMGALVTKTESGRGCGDDWPLCNGKFVPAYTVESIIEYSHRAVSGLVGLLVLGTAILTALLLRRRKDAMLYAFGALFFTVFQAILGAMAVLWPQSDAVLALHFGISLVAFAFTLLLAIGVWRQEFWPDERHKGPTRETHRAGSAITRKFRNVIWGVTVYCYGVVYLGAYVRHTESSGGCMGWPLCNGQVVPELTGATGIVFAHRAGAALLFAGVAYIAYRAHRNYPQQEELVRATQWALALTGLQIISGATIVYTLTTDWYLLTALIHVILISGLFGVLCYLCILSRRLSLASADRADVTGTPERESGHESCQLAHVPGHAANRKRID